MKKLMIFFVALSFSFLGNSQEVEKTEKKTERIQLVNGGESVDANKVRKKISPQQELANCKKQLEALDKKEAYIRSTPSEMELANKNGWFDKADIARASIENRIEELKSKLKK